MLWKVAGKANWAISNTRPQVNKQSSKTRHSGRNLEFCSPYCWPSKQWEGASFIYLPISRWKSCLGQAHHALVPSYASLFTHPSCHDFYLVSQVPEDLSVKLKMNPSFCLDLSKRVPRNPGHTQAMTMSLSAQHRTALVKPSPPYFLFLEIFYFSSFPIHRLKILMMELWGPF